MPHKFKFPSQTTVIGPSQSGKTSLLRKILESPENFETPPDVVYWFYMKRNAVPDLPNVQAIEGLPDLDLIEAQKPGPNVVIVMDDLQTAFSRDKSGRQLLSDLMCVHAHHNNYCLFNLIQSAFSVDRTSRTNSTYLILMRSKADTLQTRNILSQLFDKNFSGALEAFNDATADDYGYLLVDNHPRTHEDCRLLTNILDPYPIVYVFRNKSM